MVPDAASPEAMELAWHLLAVLVRLGRPAAACHLAAAASGLSAAFELAAVAGVPISPRSVKWLCSLPGSPLRFSGGVVTASETAAVAFLRIVGWDVGARPRVSLRISGVRRWCNEVPIRYERKRKASDAGHLGAKRRLLMAPDADLVGHKQQLVVHSCLSVATGEVHLEVTQGRLPIRDTCTTEPSLEVSAGVTLVSSVAKSSTSCVRPEVGDTDGNVLGNMTSGLMPREVSNIACCIDNPTLFAEKSENTAADNEVSQIREPEEALPLPLYYCRVEDSDDQENEFILLPTTVKDALVGGAENGTGGMSCLQPKLDRFLGGNDGNVLGNMASAVVTKELSNIPWYIHNASICAEESENANAVADNEVSRIGQPEDVLFFYNCRAKESDDRQKESIPLPTTVDAALVGDAENGIEEDLNLICKRSSSPFFNCNTKEVGNILRADVLPDQAEASQNAGYCKEIPSCSQDADTFAEVHKNKTIKVLFQSPAHNKAKPAVHEVIESLCQPTLGTKVESAALPVDCFTNRNLNIIAENRETTYLNHREQPWNEGFGNLSKKEQDRKTAKQREKCKKNGAVPKEHKDQLVAKAQKGLAEPKQLPSFKLFAIEEEEGSGGYGTVYRARRKEDGKVFAIKCPHAKAQPHHVDNERKMLERFGGKNFVIKYESSFRSGELECFVLEHVEHDRPENLKKEIDVFELQWYGYCLFKALSSLHKQGIVHRDVKPGNFLFSRKLTKGYLIDFNLANDLNQRFLRNSKSETISCGKDVISQSTSKSALVIHAKEAATGSKQPPGSKRKRSNRSPVCSAPRIDDKSRNGSQAADASGVTSAKDPTSTKTPLERLKQPMPYRGRKEIMNFLHEAMQTPKQNTLAAPVFQRKRVAAPLGSADRKLFVLTPMPLLSGGSAVAGSGTFNSKGHGKQRREGPCVGTKGFRAPEVLFRSFHQSCKVDVWSAGVTLLYLIIGKTPFGGDPEQNIKDIAKLKGSEELWEVAKLHNCESSFPSELFDVKSLHSVDLREWCAANARRPVFLKLIPDSLFDLVDKCLAVNPRCRISSEDALAHEFLAPCRESLKKQKERTLRKSAVASDPSCLPQGTMVKSEEL